MLVLLGQPAIAEGSTIRIGENAFNVEEACSGLRIFVGIVALAFAYVVVVRRSWVIKGLLFASVLPVTIIANSARIVATCLLFLYVSGDASKKFSHDIAGFVMIPFAAVLLGLVLWYLGKLIREVEVAGIGYVIRNSSTEELRRRSPSR
jgi:exosortase